MKHSFGALFLFIALGFVSGQAQALEVGGAAPCVVLNHVAADNSESEHCIREPNQAGQKVLIEFFSATCSDCQANLPKFAGLAQELGGVATFRAIGIDRNESLLRNYINSHRMEIPFEVALDIQRDAKMAYGVVSTPTLFILDSSNTVVYKHEGVLSDVNLEQIRTLVRN